MKQGRFTIRPKVIVKELIQSYVYACFITIMIMFFSNDDILSFEKITCSKSTWIIFLVIAVLEISYNLFCILDCWLGEQHLGKAILENAEPEAVKIYGKRVCAIHEAGHALMAYIKNIEFSEVSLCGETPHIKTLAYVTDSQGVLDRILMLYAGAAAEEILTGNFGPGCLGNEKGDFSQATGYIKEYIVLTNADVSKTLLDEELAPEMIRISKELYSSAKKILSDNKKVLEIIVENLLEKDVLSYEDINKLIENDKIFQQRLSVND